MNERITEILNDPCCSYWLKDALKSAINRDCLDAARDADLLAEILRERCDSIIFADTAILNLTNQLKGE